MARVLISSFCHLTSLACVGLRNYRSNSCERTLCFSYLIRRTMAYSTHDSGAPNSLEYRMYFRKYSLNLKSVWISMHFMFSLEKIDWIGIDSTCGNKRSDTQYWKSNRMWWLVFGGDRVAVNINSITLFEANMLYLFYSCLIKFSCKILGLFMGHIFGSEV